MKRIIEGIEEREFKKVLRYSQEELILYLPKRIKQIKEQQKEKFKILSSKKWIFGEGNIPVLLVAHLDTVFTQKPEKIYIDEKEGVWFSPNGLGADDRAGVIGILEILKAGYSPFWLFCCDEETGGEGARLASESYFLKEYKNEFNFMIELDRQGKKDSVFYDCVNYDFQEYINKFGFESAWGTFSDISILAKEWKKCAVNLSTGYYYQHTKHEILKIPQLIKTLNKTINILEDNKEKNNKFDYKEFIYQKNYSSPYGNIYYNDDFYKEYHKAKGREGKRESGIVKDYCDICGNWVNEKDLNCFEEYREGGFDLVWLCSDCLEYEWEGLKEFQEGEESKKKGEEKKK